MVVDRVALVNRIAGKNRVALLNRIELVDEQVVWKQPKEGRRPWMNDGFLCRGCCRHRRLW